MNSKSLIRRHWGNTSGAAALSFLPFWQALARHAILAPL